MIRSIGACILPLSKPTTLTPRISFAIASVALWTMASARKSSHKLVEHGTTLILEPVAKQTSTVIFMHGLGDTAEGWIDATAQVFGPALPNTKFVLPTATTRPITINMGMPMPGWYDIESLSGSRDMERCDGIESSRKKIIDLIQAEEAAGIPSNRVVLGGFSQGGAMSIFVGMNYPKTLGGVLVMSGYMPLPDSIKFNDHSLQTPVLMLHGDADGVVPLAFGKDGHKRMETAGVKDLKMNVYRGLEHSANDKELADALAFLKGVLKDDDAPVGGAGKEL